MIPHKDDQEGWIKWNKQREIRATKGSLPERFLRLRALLTGRTPTLGEFGLAAGYRVFWDADFLASAIGYAESAGLDLPPEWKSLSEFALLYPLKERRSRSLDVQTFEKFSKIALGSLGSSDPAVCWSALSVIANVLHRLGSSLGAAAKDPAVKPLLTQILGALPETLPSFLDGAEFEAAMIWIALSSHRTRLLWAAGGQFLQVETALDESRAAQDIIGRFQPGWRAGHSIGVDAYKKAKKEFFNQLSRTSAPAMTYRVIAAEPNLIPYLNLINDAAFHHSNHLSRAAYYHYTAERQIRRSALIYAARWAVTAWEAERAKRGWHEDRHRERTRGISTSGYRIHQDEFDALLLAVSSLQVAGCEPLAAALASLSTSYAEMTGVVTRRDPDVEVPYSLDHRLMSVRQEFGWLIRQLGFEVLGGTEAEHESPASEYRTRRLSDLQRSLFERVSHATPEETECWRVVEEAIGAIPKLSELAGIQKHRQRPQLLRHLYHAIIGDGLGVQNDAWESTKVVLVRPVFQLCLMRWHLRWAARLLAIEGTQLAGEDLQQFLSAWQFSRSLAPELIGPQTDFHQRAKGAFARISDLEFQLDDHQYYSSLEAINAPLLAMWNGAAFDAGQIFERWIKKDIHTLAVEMDVDRSRLGLRAGLRAGVQTLRAVVAAPIEELQSELARRQNCVWISFIVGGRLERPEIIGITLDDRRGVRRWRQDLDPVDKLAEEAVQYVQSDVDKAIRRFARPPRLSKKPALSRLVDILRKESNEAERVFLSCPPELNSLPWRWLIRGERGGRQSSPTVCVVPGASWFVRRGRSNRSGSNLAIRTGHGTVIEIGEEFKATPIVETSQSTASVSEAARDLAELRVVCRKHSIVIDNRCFGGHSGRWRGSEWNGNPAMLLVTRCRLFVAPPCRIPVSTADSLTNRLRDLEAAADATTVIAELDALSATDPAGWLYNVYGSP